MGGALAQIAAAYYSDLSPSLVTFATPSIGRTLDHCFKISLFQDIIVVCCCYCMLMSLLSLQLFIIFIVFVTVHYYNNFLASSHSHTHYSLHLFAGNAEFCSYLNDRVHPGGGLRVWNEYDAIPYIGMCFHSQVLVIF